MQGDHLTYSEFDTLAEAVGCGEPGAHLVDPAELCAVKDAIEVENIRRAIDIQQKVLWKSCPPSAPAAIPSSTSRPSSKRK